MYLGLLLQLPRCTTTLNLPHKDYNDMQLNPYQLMNAIYEITTDNLVFTSVDAEQQFCQREA